MTAKDPYEQLVGLLHKAESAHERAYAETHGVDPDWPSWYADYLVEPLKELLEAGFTRSELIYLLVLVDKEQRLRAPGSSWTSYFARFFAERYT
jgi:hypothetical protein